MKHGARRLVLGAVAGSAAFFGWLATAADATPLSAEKLLTRAQDQAAANHGAVFVHFGASWCGWCKRLDAFLEKPEIKPVFEKYFVPVKIVVSESAQNKALENSGGDALFRRFGGPDGLPYSAFLDAKGALIVNSRADDRKGGNIGYPANPKEVDWFVQMMKKAAPNIAAADLSVIEKALRDAIKPSS